MRYYFLILVFLFSGLVYSQCLTSYQKLSPDNHINPFTHEFGKAMDVRGDIAVVSIPHSDSLQNNAGLVYVYKYIHRDWKKIAELHPSDPHPNMFFGSEVKIKNNHIYVGSMTYPNIRPANQGAIYIFKQPPDEWTTTTEDVKLALPPDIHGLGSKFEVNEEEDVIAMYLSQGMYFYTREHSDWSSKDFLSEILVDYPTDKVHALAIHGDLLVFTHQVGFEYEVKVQRALDSKWTSFQDQIALMRNSNDSYFFGHELQLTGDHLLVSVLSENSDSTFLYQTKDDWASVEEEIVLNSAEPLVNYRGQNNRNKIYMDDSTILVLREYDFKFSAVSIYHKPVDGWTNSVEDQLIKLPENDYISYNNHFTYAPEHLLVQGKFADYLHLNEDQILFYSLEDPVPVMLKSISYQEHNTSGANYGRTVAIFDNVMAVKSYDNNYNDIYRGVIYLYQKDGNGTWQHINTIKDEGEMGGSINLGFSMDLYRDYLVLGAPGYQEEGSGRTTGRVFVYKKQEDWSKIMKIAELRPSNWREAKEESTGMWLSFGYEVEIDENVIFVGAPGKNFERGNTQDHGMIYVFEKQPREEWSERDESAQLNSAFSVGNAKIGANFTFADNTLFTNHHWSSSYGQGIVSAFEKPETGWKDTVENYAIRLKHGNPNYFGFNGSNIVVQNDQLFLGDRLYASGGVNSSGRILVVKKSPTGWKDSEIVSSIELRNPAEYQMLGVRFEVKENILIAGSSFIYNGYYYGEERKGEVSILQSLDPDWQNVIELLTLTGDKTTNVDGFGISIATDTQDFVIGSYNDDSETGYGSGAAYVVPMPPVVRLVEPVCEAEEIVPLYAYPGGGVWSGPGISDGTQNVFNARMAGTGIHELTYETPNCHYLGRLRIDVRPKSEIRFKHELNIEICKDDSIMLEIDSTGLGSYAWFFLSDTAKYPVVLGQNIPTQAAVFEGKFWVENYDVLCPSVSDTVIVAVTYDSVVVDAITTICDPLDEVNLVVNPEGGYWNKDDISANNVLTARNLSPGDNTFVYTYPSSNKCTYSDTLIVLFDPLEISEIPMSSHEICATTEVTIPIQPYENTKYYLHQIHENDVTKTPITTNYLKLSDEGTYKISVEKHYCTLSSEDFEINYLIDSVFFPNVITHNQDLINDFFEPLIENAKFKQIRIYNRYGDLVFSSNAYKNNWPDKKYPTGTYFFDFYYSTICNPEIKDAKGWIQLME